MKIIKAFWVVLAVWAVLIGTVATGQAACTDSPGLTHWWSGDANTNDLIAGKNAALQGGATYGTGLVGGAFLLNGNGGFVSIPDDPTLNFRTGSFTVDFWVHFNSLDGIQVLAEKWRNTGSAFEGWTLVKMDDNRISCAYAGAAGNLVLLTSDPVYSFQEWNHVALTGAAGAAPGELGTVAIYLNGVRLVSQQSSYDLNTAASLKFGHRGTSGDNPGSTDTDPYFLNGLIDEVEFFDTALSDLQISDIYVAGGAARCKDSKLNQTIRVGGAPVSATFGKTFDVWASATSSLPVTIAGSGSCSGTGQGTARITMNSGTGTCTVTFEQAGDDNFNPASTVTNLVAAIKSDPRVTVWPSVPAIAVGTALGDVTLTGGTTSVPGTFAFTNPTTLPPAGTTLQSVTFTPTDSNYNTVVGMVNVSAFAVTPNSVLIQKGFSVTAAPTSAVDLVFANVLSAGTVTATPTTYTAPANYVTLNGSSYNISATAGFTGAVTVCIDYDPAVLRLPAHEPDLKLLHYKDGNWVNITTSVNTSTTPRSVCGTTTSLSPFIIAEPSVCSPPATISVPATSTSGKIPVSWGRSSTPGVTYTLEYSTGGEWTAAYTGIATSTTVTVTAAGAYTFRVSASKAGLTTSFYTTSTSSCDVALACSTPATITVPAASNTGSIYVSWERSDAPAPMYVLQVSKDGGPFTTVYTGTNTSTTVKVAAGGQYQFQVQATKPPNYTPSSFKLSSACTVTLTCGMPATITAVPNNSTGKIVVSWGSSNVAGAIYVLQASTDNGSNFTTVYSGPNTTATIPAADGTYLFQVQATKPNYTASAFKISGPYTVTLTCPTPATITVPATSNTGKIFVAWGSSLAGARYLLQVSKDNGPFTNAYSGTGTTTTVTVVANGNYVFRVQASKAGYATSGVRTSTVCAVTFACSAPATIAVPATNGTGTILVSWGSSDIAGATYTLKYSKDSSGTLVQAYSGTSTSAVIKVPAPINGSYVFQVQASKTGYASSGITTSTPCVVNLACSTPASITVPATNSTGTILVSWGSSNVPGATYVLQAKNGAGAFTTVYSGTSTSATVKFDANGTYVFQVQATKLNYADSGVKTSTACVVTLACGKPSYITVPPSSSTRGITVRWGTSNVPGVTYVLERSTDKTTWTPAGYTGTSTSATVTVPSAGTYYFQVKATRAPAYAESGYTTSTIGCRVP